MRRKNKNTRFHHSLNLYLDIACMNVHSWLNLNHLDGRHDVDYIYLEGILLSYKPINTSTRKRACFIIIKSLNYTINWKRNITMRLIFILSSGVDWQIFTPSNWWIEELESETTVCIKSTLVDVDIGIRLGILCVFRFISWN